MMWGIVLLFVILSIVFFLGKGSFLIAGYNTASAKQKAKYDEKKLCRVMGIGTSLIAILLAISAYYEGDFPSYLQWVIPGGIFVVIAYILIASNKCCKSKKDFDSKNAEEEELKEKKRIYGSLAVSAVIGVFVVVMLFTGRVDVSLGKTQMDIKVSYWSDASVFYENIEKIEYSKDMKVGNRVGGLGSFQLQAGNFSNKEFGNYHLYAYTGCREYVILKTTKGIIVVNGKDEQATMELYENIVSNKNGGH